MVCKETAADSVLRFLITSTQEAAESAGGALAGAEAFANGTIFPFPIAAAFGVGRIFAVSLGVILSPLSFDQGNILHCEFLLA